MAIEVNQSEWNGISEEDRAKIQQIIQSNFQGSTIAPSANAAKSTEALANRQVSAFNFKNPFCTAACGVAEAAAVAACAALSGPAAALCVAAAHAAGEYCRSKC